MRALVAWLFLSASVVSAQTGIFSPDYYFPSQLKAYLALSDDQVVRMGSAKAQIQSLQLPKLQRQGQLQQEIAEETAKTVPDAAALGKRYAELESIRRELETLQKNLVPQLQAILGADQKAKLAALQQALALYSTACDALGQNLLVPLPVTGGLTGAIGQFPTSIIPTNRFSPITYASFLLGAIVPGCTGAYPNPLLLPPLAVAQP